MKRTTSIVLAAAIALSMTACTALDSILGFNLFTGLAAVSESDIQEANVAELKDLSGSPSFYDTIAEDDALKVAVLLTINEERAVLATDTADYQELTLLAAQIELQTTPAGELVNNIGGIFDDVAAGTLGTDIGFIMEQILPVSVFSVGTITDEAAFVAMIDALVAADLYYSDLGGSLVDGAYAADSAIVPGDVAQSAIVAAMVGNLVPPAGYTTGEYLIDLINEVPGTPEITFDMDAVLTDPSLVNILTAAGMGSLTTTTP